MPIVAEYFAEETLKDGSAVTIRAMRPDDKERLVEAFLRLQPKTVRMRFFHAKQHLGDDELGRNPGFASRAALSEVAHWKVGVPRVQHCGGNGS